MTRSRRRCRGAPGTSAPSCWCSRPNASACAISWPPGAKRSPRAGSRRHVGRSMSTRSSSRACQGLIISRFLRTRPMPDPVSPDLRARLSAMFEEGVRKIAPGAPAPAIVLERPKQAAHGDFACAVAMQLAKTLKRAPREIATQLVAALPASPLVEKVEIAGAGFINLFLKRSFKQQVVNRVLAAGAAYGKSAAGGKPKVQVEFVSANPTGPLHVGHGRQAALGDAIAAMLEAQGHAITREFYYNDAGAQIDKLAWSVQARAKGIKPGAPGWPEEGYAGDYIEDIAGEITDPDDLDAVRRHAVAYLRKEQDADLQAFGVKFDVYYLESSLYTDGKVEAAVKALVASGRT